MGEYLDMQAAMGITKHQGGLPATRQLLALCHIDRASEVLDVGCGIGVGPAYIARTHGCRVVGVDASPAMIAWSRRRAREAGVEDRVALQVADVLALPFEDDRFDVVLAESVLAFVEDKAQAIRELVRVTKPGGYVGLNEAVWLEQDRQNLEELAHDLGAEVLGAGEWRALWDASGLRDRVVRLRLVEAGVEVRSRMRWIGLPWLVRAWGRVIYFYLTRPAIRHSFHSVLAGGRTLDHWYYGLFVGRK